MAETFTPPQDVADNARRALEVRASKPPSQRGMTAVGLARAKQLSNRQPVSLDTIARMVSYFDRHAVDKDGATWDEQGKGWQAWYGWGGDEGRTWANRILKEHKVESKASRRHSETDMKLIRTARKNLMDTLNVLVELGDDGAEDVMDAAHEAMASKRYAVKDVAVSAVLTQLLAQTVSMFYTASAAHWNVTSLDFPQYHAFFESVYETMEEHIDPTAELIRAQGAKVPTSLGAMAAMCNDYGVDENATVVELLQCLSDCNADMLGTIAQGIAVTGAVGEYGVQNYLQDRMVISQKLAWMMRSSLQGDGSLVTIKAEPAAALAQVNLHLYEGDPELFPINQPSDIEEAYRQRVLREDGIEGREDFQNDLTAIANTLGPDYIAQLPEFWPNERKAAEDRNTTPAQRQDMPAEDFVFPETRNFPIVTPDDIPAAVSSWGRYGGDETFETFKAKLIALAKRKGAEFVDALPKEWLAEMENKSFDTAAKMEVTEEMRTIARRLLGGR